MAFKPSYFKAAGDYSFPKLDAYLTTIKQQQNLLKLLKSVLPTPLESHALYAVTGLNKVLLYTDSAVWATQLRFFFPSMLEKLHHAGFARIDSVQVRLLDCGVDKTVRRKPRLPNRGNIHLVRQTASQQQDKRLTAALLKLSKTLEKRSQQL